MICDRKVCAPLDCATDEIILDESSCCPRCQLPKKKCRYKGKVYKVCKYNFVDRKVFEYSGNSKF